jgi:pyruvate/2-oxoglutarate dehydrogenase complex dihydrolipoamide dehydrogenase (E3) component
LAGPLFVPDLPGIDRIRYLSNTSMLKLDRVPSHLGGSYIGLEFAQMYRRFGAAVTVVEMKPRLVSREDEDVHRRAHGRRVYPF